MVDVPLDADVTPDLGDDAARAGLGVLLSAMLRGRQASDPRHALMQAIGALKVTAYRNGLTDAVLEEELRAVAVEERLGGIR